MTVGCRRFEIQGKPLIRRRFPIKGEIESSWFGYEYICGRGIRKHGGADEFFGTKEFGMGLKNRKNAQVLLRRQTHD
jgi:hypothetical protein